jgi:cytochrome c oxidase cbb3-type subunit I/II
MPRYGHILTSALETRPIGAKMRALRKLGVPYTEGEIDTAPVAIEAQARQLAADVEAQQGPKGLADKEIVALTAYLQRLGTDIKWKRVAPQPLIAAAPGGGK